MDMGGGVAGVNSDYRMSHMCTCNKKLMPRPGCEIDVFRLNELCESLRNKVYGVSW